MRPPIAIIGLGCRFPGGAHSPADYLRLLEEGRDGVIDLPADRWSAQLHCDDDNSPGRSPVRRGGFLPLDLFAFEPAFFGISAREAATLDPQQRLLLEVAWEALEDAGQTALRGSNTGVYIGGFTLDAMLARFSAANQDAIDNHTATSSSMTLLSNRLSYAFDLRGPSLTVDTACSSSLVALHLAAEALHSGTCTMALAGGVNAMWMPYYPLVMSKGRFLAPDGRCKTFEESADGYGRGEGAGIVVLKTLDRALRDGDRIHALLRATGVNQDGATDGIALPNPQAQRALIEETAARAGVDPATIGFVEAHGTGTQAGDRAETTALGATYARGRAAPLAIGSVKAQIGHLEAAAGVAGLIKAVLSVREGRIFPHRRLLAPNPDLGLSALGLDVPQEARPWPLPGPARAAVNSFGYGGTNAHALVEAPPPRPPRAALCRPGPFLLPLSARSAPALAAFAGTLAAGPLPDLADLAGALAHARPEASLRAALVTDDPTEARAALQALATGAPHPALIGPHSAAGGRVWVYSGMGPQWPGMGAALYAEEPVFAAAIDEADAHFVALAGWSIKAALLAPADRWPNSIAQPANLLLQVGLTRLLRAQGAAPDALLGHSVGEVAAAWAAGCLTLAEAVAVAFHRSRLQQRAAGQGGMLALGCSRAEAEDRIAAAGLGLVVAADNAPQMVTLAGPEADLTVFAEKTEAAGLFARSVRVEVPYHSPAMEPLRDELLASLAHLQPKAPQVPLFSTLTGAPITGPTHDADYWWRNTRAPVRLLDATRAALQDGHRTFVELGPHPALGPSVAATLAAQGLRGQTLHAQRRDQPGLLSFRRAQAAAWTLGQTLDWAQLTPRGRAVALPPTAFQRSHHQAETPSARLLRLGDPEAHPLLAQRADSPEPAWTTRLAGPHLRYLRDHEVDSAVVLPGAAFIEAALAASLRLHGEAQVEDLRFDAALVLPPGQAIDLRLDVSADRLRIHSRVGATTWSPNAQARLRPKARYQPAALPPAGHGAPQDVSALYAGLQARGLRYGPAFRTVRALWTEGDHLRARLSTEADTTGYLLHPTLLDGALQCLVALAGSSVQAAVLPLGVARVRCQGPVGPEVEVHATLRATGPDRWEGDLLLISGGAVQAELRGLRCGLALRRELGEAFVSDWIPQSPPPATHSKVALLCLRPGATLPPLPPAETLILDVQTAEDPVAPCLLLHAALRAAEDQGVSRVLVQTQSGLCLHPGEPASPAAAALHGLLRVAMNERPALQLQLLDVDQPDEALAAALITAPRHEEELALRQGRLYARRIRRAPTLPPAQPDRPAEGRPMALEIGQPGRLDSLRWRHTPRRPPGPGEVEIAVEAASLNFKDVMKAMGLLGAAALENAYLGQGLGLEATGRVVSAGPDSPFAPGEAVFAYVGGALRSHVTVDHRFVVRRPANVDAAAGASMFVFLTAWYALVHQARLVPGETVLIHSAAGGVGLAALQIARNLGATVYATAGTPDKREALRQIGLTHIYDSRTLDFAAALRADTKGQGVDVVLNSLSGPALEESLSLVAPGGRFIELGKQDLTADRGLGLAAFNRSISLHAVDLDRLATERPGWFAPVAQAVADAFADGRLRPLPTQTFAADEAAAAFRALASGGLLGKAVLVPQGAVSLAPARPAPIGPGAWLLTGGLGGFGLRAAAALVARGVRRLVLAGRRGAVDPADQPLVAALRAQGAAITEVALDVTDAAAVSRLVNTIPDLRGLLHAAMELADAPWEALRPADLNRALGAKVRGALHLHAATAALPLDHFVLMGSFSAQLGNPGQAAYAAANAALDGLAWARAAAGLPATCVSFGPLAEAGVVARDPALAAHLHTLGVAPLPPEAAFAHLDRALAAGSPAVTVAQIDWDQWAEAVPGSGWQRLDGLRRAEARAASTGEGPDPAAALMAAAAQVFRAEAATLDPSRSLRDQGLDSILAVELATELGARLGRPVSAMALLAGRSLADLARSLGGTPSAAPGLRLRDRICVTAPYFSLTDLTVHGDRLQAKVVPDGLAHPEGSPVPASEVGRHLAILGSLAAAQAWPEGGRMAFPVARATLTVVDGLPLPPGARCRVEARALSVDRTRGTATAEGWMWGLDGALVGQLRVTYHVLPHAGFVSMFAAHAAPTAEAQPGSPYAEVAPLPPVQRAGEGVRVTLPPVAVADCAGHFAGLPAMPVAILGRAALGLVRAADPAFVLGVAEVEALRFAWAGAVITLEATPSAEGWMVEGSVDGAPIARWRLRPRG